ncbi:xylulokinase [Candidatus Vecturithrix granuli]|uniref:Xylulokinase n=1 Tax=Vecturithrix granuli TaxID=1499967 RepID=A0A081C8N8_VECG1|nr:xylulokinase [Candidatus Vecturithrix granuli]
MSLLGVDVGTSGCKSVVFSETGTILASAYQEYDFQAAQPGWAELDSNEVWENIQQTIHAAASQTTSDPIKAVCASSCGEAVVPVSEDRQILGASLLNFDVRGLDYVNELRHKFDAETFYQVNGNTIGNNYTLPKLLWIRDHQPELYARTYKFLHWGSFVPFMLGSEPSIDFSLANRSLLFDLERETWSETIAQQTDIDLTKLPVTVPSGTVIGAVDSKIARQLGLPPNIPIVAGAHDQCSNAVGCGVIKEGFAMYGMGTFICIVPVFHQRKDPQLMLERGLNTEHHAAPGAYVSFIYNDGGSLVKWFRDTFARLDKQRAQQEGYEVYDHLFAEMPERQSKVMVLPHFSVTGPPQFLTDSCGLMAGLKLETSRGEILKGIIEGATFYIKECVNALPATGTEIQDFRAVGGGSKSDTWIQISADILGRPFIRPKITEAGALGAAIMAGAGCGIFASVQEGVAAMVQLDKAFEPDMKKHEAYQRRFEIYQKTWPLLREYLQELAAE